MTHFVFKAKKPNGEIYKSERDADDRYELYKLVRESGDEILDFKEKSLRGKIKFNISIMSLFKRVKMVERINLARNLGSMLEAGLALSRALSVLERQSRNKTFKSILNGIIEDVGKGSTFSDALAKYPKVFSELFVSMVHAGEQSGTLAESLRVVSIQMENSHNLERRIRGAMIYPAIIVSVMILIAVLMFIFVVPVLMNTFVELNVPLPMTTRIVLGVSDFMRSNGLLILLMIIVVVGGVYYWSKSALGKNILHRLILKIPLVGGLVQEINSARTARTLSSLLGSGVDVVESVSITANVVQNVHFRAVLKNAEEAIKKGELMSKIFDKNTKLYPVFLAEMMSVGEETGKIGEMLMGVAKYYEDDVEQKTKDMSTVIEPFLMVIIAAAVGFFAISMISPMYSLVDAI